MVLYSTKKRESAFQKKIKKIINDAKKFNKQVDDYIRKTEYERTLPPPPIDRGFIRKMKEQEEIIKKNEIEKQKQKNYELAKKQYENDLHEIMEKIISIKEK